MPEQQTIADGPRRAHVGHGDLPHGRCGGGLAWVDASAEETSFVVERCEGGACTSFTQLTEWPALAGTGSHPWYADCTGLKAGRTHYCRVGAVNSFGVSCSPSVAVLIR